MSERALRMCVKVRLGVSEGAPRVQSEVMSSVEVFYRQRDPALKNVREGATRVQYM